MSSMVFTVIGDSNVVDNMTSFNTASREVMKGAQVITCPILSKLSEAFMTIRCDQSSFYHVINFIKLSHQASYFRAS